MIKKILLIYSGGTIGMIRNKNSNKLIPFTLESLLLSVPELQNDELIIEYKSINRPIDSSNMNTQIWVEIVDIIEKNYDEYNGFVILHGTDTMSYTASALSFMLENLAKPVIFTGSQLPIGDLRTDAKENLITAIQIAALRKRNRPYITEVGLYFEYKLYRGNRSSKISAEHFEAFKSPNYPPLATSGVHLNIEDEKLLPYSRKKLLVHRSLARDILVVHLYPGIDQKLLTSIFENATFSGVILLTFGSGNSTTSLWFTQLLKKIIHKNIPIVNITQCTWGSVQMGSYETSTGLKNIGIISGKDLTIEAAITKMMYLNSQNLSPKVFKTIFETSLRGEMS